jgi:hypothetical protein
MEAECRGGRPGCDARRLLALDELLEDDPVADPEPVAASF